MAARQHLRSAKPGEKPRRKQTVYQAADSGDLRALLVAMRERIAKTVSDPECPPRDLAALTRRLHDIAKELDAIDLRAKQEITTEGAVADEEWDAETL